MESGEAKQMQKASAFPKYRWVFMSNMGIRIDNYKQISEDCELVYRSGFKQTFKRKDLIAFSE